MSIKSVFEPKLSVAQRFLYRKNPLKDRSSGKIKIARETENSVILDKLSKEINPHIRLEVSKNENTKPDTLVSLSKDKNTAIRSYVAQHNNTPPNILRQLLKDQDTYYVVAAAANNKNTPPDALEEIIFLNDDKKMREYISDIRSDIIDTADDIIDTDNDKYKKEIRELIRHYKETKYHHKRINNTVLLAALKNPSTPKKVRDKFKGSLFYISNVPHDEAYFSPEGRDLYYKTLSFGMVNRSQVEPHQEDYLSAY